MSILVFLLMPMDQILLITGFLEYLPIRVLLLLIQLKQIVNGEYLEVHQVSLSLMIRKNFMFPLGMS